MLFGVHQLVPPQCEQAEACICLCLPHVPAGAEEEEEGEGEVVDGWDMVRHVVLPPPPASQMRWSTGRVPCSPTARHGRPGGHGGACRGRGRAGPWGMTS